MRAQVRAVEEHAASLWGVPLDELRSRSQRAAVAEARAAVFWVARHVYRGSWGDVGKWCARPRDTVRSGAGRAERRRDRAFVARLEALRDYARACDGWAA